MAFRDRIDVLHQYGSLIGTAVSAFLLAMALLNLFILFNVWRQFRSVTRGESVRAHDEAIPAG